MDVVLTPIEPVSMPKTIALLRNVPLFSLLEDKTLTQVAEAAQPVALERDQVLFFRGDASRGFYVVVQGRIKLYIDGPNGVEKVIETVGPGGTFGEAVMFLRQPYPVNTAALTPAEVLFIPRDVIERLLDANRDFCQRMLAGMAMRLRSLIHDIETYSVCSATQRVIGYLLQLLPEAGVATNDGPILLELPVQKYVLASRLNLKPETLSRVFSDLAAEGLLRTSGRKVWILDLEGLRAFAPQEAFLPPCR
ncbi:Crp/Fnr family transcriptional regulator [Hydrogenophilus hirschii]